MAMSSEQVSIAKVQVGIPDAEDLASKNWQPGLRLIITSAGDLFEKWGYIDPIFAAQLGEELIRASREFQEQHGARLKLMVATPDMATQAIEGARALRGPSQG